MSDDDLEECWDLVRPTPVPRPPAPDPADKVYVEKAKYRKEAMDQHDDDEDIFDGLDDDFDLRAAGPNIDDEGNVVDLEEGMPEDGMEMAPLTEQLDRWGAEGATDDPTPVSEGDMARVRAAELAIQQARAELGEGNEQEIEDRALEIMEGMASSNPALLAPSQEEMPSEERSGRRRSLRRNRPSPELTREHDERAEQIVRLAGDVIGYGRIMQLCEQFWRESLEESGTPGGELTHLHLSGPCAITMVPCPATHDPHCDWCCGAGRVTERVAQAIREQGGPPPESSGD